jgi:hypothetical protein
MDELEEGFGELGLDEFKRPQKTKEWKEMMNRADAMAKDNTPQIILLVERLKNNDSIHAIIQTRNFEKIPVLIGLGPEHNFEIYGNMPRQIIFPKRGDGDDAIARISLYGFAATVKKLRNGKMHLIFRFIDRGDIQEIISINFEPR